MVAPAENVPPPQVNAVILGEVVPPPPLPEDESLLFEQELTDKTITSPVSNLKLLMFIIFIFR